jgi:sugar lactone lactonase YvrE
VDLPAHHVTCPAFGGEDFKTLYVPSALQNIPASVQKEAPEQGMTFSIEGLASGVPEPRVLL